MATPQGLHESRTRVTIHLPVNDGQQEKAFFKIINYIHGLKGQANGVSGYTRSSMRPATFHGWWYSDAISNWLRDEIVLITVDYLLSLEDSCISEQVKELKQTIHRWYRHYKAPQEEVWVIAQPVIRQD